ncbi:MAG: hypothetical protein ChlgKO_05440 [Chlamydiales bacterium]
MKYFFLFLLGFAINCGVGQFSPKYQIATSFPTLEEKPFVILMCGYNAEKYVEKALRSVLEQEYSNYRLIYIDDASEDKSHHLVKTTLEKHKKIENLLIQNPHNVGAMANLKRGFDLCKDQEIIVHLDADDLLAHPYALKKLNEIYANPDVWLTYGSYLDIPTYAPGKFARPIPKQILQKGKIREHPWSSSHLRTYYAGLAKKIHLEDLKIDGEFLPSTSDLATMYPMIEMAGTHAYFVPECLHQYQISNPTSDCFIRQNTQSAIAQKIRSKTPYTPLEEFCN